MLARPATIALINPNSDHRQTRAMAALARRELAGRGRVLGLTNTTAPPLLTTTEDLRLAEAGVLALGLAAAARPGVTALVVAAFGDPGLAALRARTRRAVFGIGEEAFHQAACGGRPFSIVTITPAADMLAGFGDKATALGYGRLYQGVRVTPGEPQALLDCPHRLDQALYSAIAAAVVEDGAGAVIMGGGPLSAAGQRLQSSFEVPLVVPVQAAMAAALRASRV